MPTLARLSLWVPPERMDTFETAYKKKLVPILKKYGLEESSELGRRTVEGIFSRLFEVEKVGFVDVWCRFVGRQDLYLRDGLHLTSYGAEVFGEELLKVMSGSTPFLGLDLGGWTQGMISS